MIERTCLAGPPEADQSRKTLRSRWYVLRAFATRLGSTCARTLRYIARCHGFRRLATIRRAPRARLPGTAPPAPKPPACPGFDEEGIPGSSDDLRNRQLVVDRPRCLSDSLSARGGCGAMQADQTGDVLIVVATVEAELLDVVDRSIARGEVVDRALTVER